MGLLCHPHLPDPRLQRLQLLGVLVAGLVVGGNGSGDGRERNACGGRISISGGLGQFTGGGSVVQAHKATVDSASSSSGTSCFLVVMVLTDRPACAGGG